MSVKNQKLKTLTKRAQFPKYKNDELDLTTSELCDRMSEKIGVAIQFFAKSIKIRF
jgi:hypothetical protein